MPEDPADGLKWRVDADWKREAQAEKERLAREAKPPADDRNKRGAKDADPNQAPLPPASFGLLVQQLANQALLFLSDQADPHSGEPLRRLDLAKHTIDLLGVVEEKTRGNLTPQEKQLLETVLYELRMAYVAAAS